MSIPAVGTAGGFMLLWNQDIKLKIKETESRLAWIQNQPISLALSAEEETIQCLIRELWLPKESIWRQKSREMWLKLGDHNSKFFHASTIIRRRRNKIVTIKDNNNNWVRNEKRIGQIFNEFFSNLFESCNPIIGEEFDLLFNPMISREDNDMIKKVPLLDEITSTIASMHPLKAPGPDGMSGCFYRKYWNVVGSVVSSMIQSFFSDGCLDSQINYTYICLIPKEENACMVDKFRPISLCNFAYKIISKIIATRLRCVIDKLISPLQSAFVTGRWIAESSILTQELVHTINTKKGKGGLMAIKLDMYKAFDRMEWSFLEKVLRCNGFDSQVSGLIMKCVSTVSYSVLLNGVPQKKLFPKRGLRQGDPLSPFLFLLCHEVLSKLLLRQQGLKNLQGITISRSAPAISHLMFADDTILFARANKQNVDTILKCINTYEAWSGQKCNLSKSSVLFSKNTLPSVKQNISGMLKVKECLGNEKHLGMPFVFKRKNREEFKFLRDKILQRIEGWKFRFLSLAGRTTLVKSVASSIPIYTMSTCRIPLGTCRELDSLIRKFWWTGGNDKQRYMALTSWDKLCHPLVNGSLTLVGRGVSIDIWKQPWIPWLDYDEFLTLMRNVRSRFPLLKTLGDLSNSDGGWNRSLVSKVFGSDMGNKICNITRLPTNGPDTLVWKPTKDGSFSVKEAYRALNPNQGNDYNPKFWNLIWNKDIHTRHSIMIWRALTGCLPTKDKLPFVIDKMCPLCDSALEESTHLFWDCPFASALWFGGPFPMNLANFIDSSLADRVAAAALVIPAELLVQFFIFLGCLLEHEYHAPVTHSAPHRNSSACLNTSLICMVDASWKEGTAGLAVVLLDRLNDSWKWYAKSIKSASAVEAELQAISWAMKLGKEMGQDFDDYLVDAFGC
uniref:Reverse transcriptase domain-containing protein n=1 Tax=Cannabis sativa TaxID=3483 RepID=A0A803Q9F4_CANSA